MDWTALECKPRTLLYCVMSLPDSPLAFKVPQVSWLSRLQTAVLPDSSSLASRVLSWLSDTLLLVFLLDTSLLSIPVFILLLQTLALGTI